MSNYCGCMTPNLAATTMPIVFFFFLFLILHTDMTEAAGRDTTSIFQVLSRTRYHDMLEMAGYGEEKLSTVLITGTLLCKTSSILHQQPVPVSGAIVVATCNNIDIKNKKQAWARGVTDEYGDFIFDLPSHLHAIPNLDKACSVEVLRLPKYSPCRTVFVRKHQGLQLSSVGNGIRTYTAGEILF
ncbi:hypothetical protein Ancab_033354 [Ancistrocladus abbreviatus]